MKHIVAILWPHSPFAMVTLTTLCLTPMRQGSMGTREGMYVCVIDRERGREMGGMQICSCCQLSDKDLHKLKKSPDYLPSAGSSGIALPLWVLFNFIGLHWVSQWRPPQSSLL